MEAVVEWHTSLSISSIIISKSKERPSTDPGAGLQSQSHSWKESEVLGEVGVGIKVRVLWLCLHQASQEHHLMQLILTRLRLHRLHQPELSLIS